MVLLADTGAAVAGTQIEYRITTKSGGNSSDKTPGIRRLWVSGGAGSGRRGEGVDGDGLSEGRIEGGVIGGDDSERATCAGSSIEVKRREGWELGKGGVGGHGRGKKGDEESKVPRALQSLPPCPPSFSR